MGLIFISYSRQDIPIVDIITARLKSDGFQVWIDRTNIKGGDLWTAAIVEAIDTADSFLLMLSPHSTASDNVRKEVQLAQDAKRKLFPLLIAAVTLPPQFRYQLAGIQIIDFAADPETKYRELVEVVSEHRASLVKEESIARRQAEVVVSDETLQTFGLAKQEQLLNIIANLTQTARTSLGLASLSAGSVHVFIDMPSHAAYALKAAALNRDKQLLKYKIDAIRLDGDENYVHVRSGEIGPLTIPKRRIPALARFLSIFAGVALIAGTLTTMAGGISRLQTPTSTVTVLSLRTATVTLTSTPSSTATFPPTATLTPTGTLTSSPTAAFPSKTKSNNSGSTHNVTTGTEKPPSKPVVDTPKEEYKCTWVWEIWYEYDPYTKEEYKKEGWVCK